MRYLIVGLLLATGCVTAQLTPAGEQVRITSNPEAVRGCQLVGEIDASDRMNGGMVGQMAAEENAMRTLKNKAAAMRANVVLQSSSTTGMSGSRVRGEAYQCGSTIPAAENP